jgi:hypothetical protein
LECTQTKPLKKDGGPNSRVHKKGHGEGLHLLCRGVGRQCRSFAPAWPRRG